MQTILFFVPFFPPLFLSLSLRVLFGLFCRLPLRFFILFSRNSESLHCGEMKHVRICVRRAAYVRRKSKNIYIFVLWRTRHRQHKFHFLLFSIFFSGLLFHIVDVMRSRNTQYRRHPAHLISFTCRFQLVSFHRTLAIMYIYIFMSVWRWRYDNILKWKGIPFQQLFLFWRIEFNAWMSFVLFINFNEFYSLDEVAEWLKALVC